MKIALSGSKSFLGRNLIARLIAAGYENIAIIDDPEHLTPGYEDADVFFNLLTEYRSDNADSFVRINTNFVGNILERYRGMKFIEISTGQAGNGTPYGNSKFEAEKIVKGWSGQNGHLAYIYRLQNEFGKWCPPNLNSVVATFCYNLCHDIPLTIRDSMANLALVYIDDIVNSMINALDGKIDSGQVIVEPAYQISVGDLANMLEEIAQKQHAKQLPDISDPLIKKLYSTYLSYLPEQRAIYSLNTHSDVRGSFTELLHLRELGQISINITKPGVTKGNHWHNTKTEKFIVVNGRAIIREREIGTDRVYEYKVSGNSVQVVDMLPGFTHSITNIGDEDLVTVIWANEIYDPEHPDTYYEEV